jgi:hypothetical protein
MDGLIAGVSLPSADCYVDVPRFDFDPKTDAADALGCNQRAPRTEKAIKDNVAASGAVEEGVGYERDRLDGRMEGQEVPFVALFG